MVLDVCAVSADPAAAVVQVSPCREWKNWWEEERKAGPRCLFDIPVEEVDFAGSSDFK